jgi:response regulator RpfG family c-di-GMP phosphodiesterase
MQLVHFGNQFACIINRRRKPDLCREVLSKEILPLDPIKLLIVDEDSQVLETIQSCFPASHYQCVTATSAEEAFDLLDEVEFRLVICAMSLSGVGGMEVLRRGLSRNPQVAFLMTSSPSDWEQAVEAMRMGAYDCLRKPFQCEELVLSVERAFERQRVNAEREMFQALLGKTLHDRTEHLHQALQQVGEMKQSTLEMLVVALEARENPSNMHSLRVKAFALLLAEKCGYNSALMQQLGDGSLLHDIGKIAIPDAILMKPGRLTPEEYQIMQQHSMFGYQVLSRIPHLQHAAMLALFHHERIDGTGYPSKLKGDSIPLAARIFAVVDTLDAITAGRPYCAPRTMEAARVEIRRCMGSQFDPDVVDVFLLISDEEWLAARDSIAKRYANLSPLYFPPGKLPADPFLKKAHS